jgi:hypothetical protein
VSATRIRDGFMPWAGLALGTAGFFFAHQLGSDATFQDCRIGSPWLVVVGTLGGLLVVLIGAFGSWSIYSARTETAGRRLVAAIGLIADLLFAIAMLLPFIAAFVIPGCWR